MQPNEPLWVYDKKEAEAYMPAIKRVMGGVLIDSGSLHEDRSQNTDLKVDTRCTIAVRVRRMSFFLDDSYRGEFTIRSWRKSGAQTELAKMISGFGDWMFYGFGDERTSELLGYRVIDLSALRKAISSGLRVRKEVGVKERGSNVVSARFRPFHVDDFTDFPDVFVLRELTPLGRMVLSGRAA